MRVSRKASIGAIALSMVFMVSPTLMPSVGAVSSVLRVTCLDWYTNKPATKWHVEAHVKDGDGNSIVGAVVTVKNYVDTGSGPTLYQTISGTTYSSSGVGKGKTCAPGTAANAVSPDFCAPARSPNGIYTSVVTNVTKAGYTWDGYSPPNQYVRG